MASLATACRLSARIASRRIAPESTIRGFRTSARCLAAQNFTMPALSPTMTEGNIATWKVKEGESFAAGDVLLEIETDKATMDVEAQDDGVMMKIMSGDGSKGVQVGTRIAVIAEAGDDIGSLEIPEDTQAKPTEAPKQESEPPKQEAKSPKAPEQKGGQAAKKTGKQQNSKYPLLPSVQHLINEHGIDKDAVAQITPTGPKGMLLKGDILAYLGSINAETPGAIEQRFEHLSHLDLSNIKVAEKKAVEKKVDTTPAAPVVEDSEVAVPVSLAKVIEVQTKIQASLGVFMPVSTFISRAAEVANDDLPPSSRKPTANELFNQVLGLDKLQPKGSRGYYLPQISALPQASLLARRPAPRKSDIIDLLAGPKKAAPQAFTSLHGMSSGTNVFSLVVPKGDEKRAQVFLERVKLILEKEPGRLVV